MPVRRIFCIPKIKRTSIVKIKYIVFLSVLAVAFAAVSLWVFLSGGRNAKAVRTKFRIGGLMLTVSGMLAVSGCGGGLFRPTCYETPAPQYVEFSSSASEEVRAGESVDLKVTDLSYDAYRYTVCDPEGKELQGGALELVDGCGKVTIGETGYRGYFTLSVFGVSDGGEYYLGSRGFTLI